MKLNDVVNVTKSAIAQALGEEYSEQTGNLKATDSGLLTSLGKVVTSTSQFQELFVNGVIDQMAKLEIEDVAYTQEEFSKMMVDRQEYGGFMARIYFEPTDNFQKDPSFSLEAGKDYSALEHTYFGAKYSQRLFTDAYDLLAAMSYSQEELLTAFSGWNEMNTFLTAKRELLRTMLDVRLNVWKHALAQGSIALSIGKTMTAKNLVSLYNSQTGKSLEAGWGALYDRDFLSFLCETISNDTAYIQGLSSAFTGGNHVTFSRRHNLWILKALESRIKYGLRADTFNERLLSFGDYENVKYWQAIMAEDSTAFTPKSLSSVWLDSDTCTKYGIAEDTTGQGFKRENVIGLLADYRALGIVIKRDYANTSQTASASFYTNFNHTLAQGVLDEMYPMIAYTLN